MKAKYNKKRFTTRLLHVLLTAVLSISLSIVIAPTPSVEAHATLLEMEPAEDVVAQDAPSELTLRFNEPIEHDLAMVTVYDWNGEPVFTGNPDGDVEKAPKMAFSLPDLKQGTYTVKWDVVSADGHPVNGSYAFSVGEATEGGVKSVENDGGSEGALSLVRLIPEGLILLAAGLFWFGWLAERRRFPSLDTIWKRGRRIGAVVIVLGTIMELVVYGLSLPPGIIQVIFNGRWELLMQFPFALMVSTQLLLLILAFIPGMMRGWYLALWLLLAITPAFGGHVWGMEQPFVALAPRVFHQMAIAFWLGALAYIILLLIWQKKHDTPVSWKTFRPFFSRRMIIASGLVVLSGLMMVFLQTGFISIFTDWKTWSLIVIIKVVLTLFMLSLALFQTLKWKKTETFTTKRIVKVEWLVGLVVIAFGVWMSQLSYPIAIKTYDETLVADQAEADLYIHQLKAGDRQLTATISDQDGDAPDDVTVEVSMPQHDMTSGTLTMDKDDAGDYTTDLPFTMPGTWLLEMTATYPDGEKEKWEDEIFIAGEGN